jgi:hypothetical protein
MQVATAINLTVQFANNVQPGPVLVFSKCGVFEKISLMTAYGMKRATVVNNWFFLETRSDRGIADLG